MASTYSPLLRLELIGAGEQSGLWGETTNKNLGTLLEQAVAGVTTVSLSGGAGTYTLSSLNGTQDEARSAVLKFVGNPSGAKVIEIPTKEKLYVVRNDSGQTITVRTAAQITDPLLGGVEILNREATLVFCDGNLAVAGIQTQDVGTLTVAKGGTGVTSFIGGFIKSAGGTSPLTSAATVSLATEVSGTLSVGNGGTGRDTLATNAVLLGNGTGQVQQVVGTGSGQFLGWNGTTWAPTTPPGGITSVVGTTPITASVVGNTATVAIQSGTQDGQLLVWSASLQKWQPTTVSSTGVLSFNGRFGTVSSLASDYSSFYPSLNGSYDNPDWINTLAGSKISGSVANSAALSGFAASDFVRASGAETQSIGGAKTFTGTVAFSTGVSIGITGLLKGNGTSPITVAQSSDIQTLLGTVGIANGGTNATSLAGGGVLVTNTLGTAVTSVIGTGTDQYLKWNGSIWAPATIPAGGTVTSISTGSGLTGGPITSTGTISVAANGITDSFLRQGTAYSVIGRSSGTQGNVGDINADLDGQVLRRSGSTLDFGQINLNSANAVVNQLQVTNGGTGVSNFGTGLVRANGNAALVVATSQQIVDAIGSIAVTNATTAANIGSIASTNVATLTTDQTFTTKKTFTGQVVIGTPASIGSAPSITSGAYNFTSNTSIFTTGGTDVQIFIQGNQRFRLDSSGNLNISGTLTQGSDPRLKDDIQDYTKGLDDLQNIRVRSWTYNGKGGTTKGRKAIGVVSTEIEAYMPEMIINAEGKLNPEDTQTTTIKNVDSLQMTWLLVKSVQELKAEVDSLKAQLAAK